MEKSNKQAINNLQQQHHQQHSKSESKNYMQKNFSLSTTNETPILTSETATSRMNNKLKLNANSPTNSSHKNKFVNLLEKSVSTVASIITPSSNHHHSNNSSNLASPTVNTAGTDHFGSPLSESSSSFISDHSSLNEFSASSPPKHSNLRKSNSKVSLVKNSFLNSFKSSSSSTKKTKKFPSAETPTMSFDKKEMSSLAKVGKKYSCDTIKSNNFSLNAHSIDEDISSDIYPISSISSASVTSLKCINKPLKQVSANTPTTSSTNKPIVNPFMRGSSFSSSTISTPPSPLTTNYKRKSRKVPNSVIHLNHTIADKEEDEDEDNEDDDDDDEEDEEDSNKEIDVDIKNFDKKSRNSKIKDQSESYIQHSHNSHHHHHHHGHHTFGRTRSRSKSKPDKSKNSGILGSKVATGVCAASNSWSLNTDYGEEDFMDAFRIFDTDGDGCITAKELNHVLKELGIKMSKKEIKKMIKELDNDGNGTIEYSEFVQMMTMPASRDADEFELREAFKCIDLDGNGYISREELKDAVKKIMSTDSKISVQDVEEMMTEADTDGNGLIDFEEFCSLLIRSSK